MFFVFLHYMVLALHFSSSLSSTYEFAKKKKVLYCNVNQIYSDRVAVTYIY